MDFACARVELAGEFIHRGCLNDLGNKGSVTWTHKVIAIPKTLEHCCSRVFSNPINIVSLKVLLT